MGRRTTTASERDYDRYLDRVERTVAEARALQRVANRMLGLPRNGACGMYLETVWSNGRCWQCTRFKEDHALEAQATYS